MAVCLGLATAGPLPQERRRTDEERKVRAEDAYARGREMLEEAEWERATRMFERSIDLDSSMAGAYYWLAYALNKQARRAEALETLRELQSKNPDSRWRDDAKALELEIRQSGGKKVEFESQEDEDLKLIALNALMNADEEKAVPILLKVLEGPSSPRMKEQALFVLIQTGSPQARQAVNRIARGGGNPDLQLKALAYLGMLDEDEAKPILKEVYGSTTDRRVKKAIIQSYMMGDASDELLAVVRNERDQDLRIDAIHMLGAMGATEALDDLYAQERALDVRESILQAMAMNDDSSLLRNVVKTEKEPRLKIAAIHSLGMIDDDSTRGLLEEIYRTESDVEVRGAVLDAMVMNDDAAGLIRIARGEKDPRLRKMAVERLAMVDSKEATDFLMEILDE